jgi:hypothetical protein
VVVAFVAGPVAFAKGSADLRCGVDAYEKGEFAAAEACLRRAVTSGHAHERARAYLFLALTQGARKQMAAARESFKAAIVEDPLIEPDRDRVPPEILVEYDDVRAISTGELSVMGDEAGARVLIDGQDRGAVPITVRVVAGARRVGVVSADGHRRFETPRVLVRVGARASVLATFRDQVGRVRVHVLPEGAVVRVGANVYGHKALIPLRAGKHEIVLSKPGFIEVTRTLVVGVGHELVLRERLARAPRHAARWIGGWTALGSGAAALLIGAVLGASSSSAASDLATAHRAGTLTTTEYLSLKSTAEGRARGANVLFLAGGAAAATGLVLLVLSGRGESAQGGDRKVRIVPLGTGAALAWSF